MKGIKRLSELEVGKLYTTDGKDVWEIVGYFDCPSLTIKNIRTGETMNGGIGCLLFKNFIPLIPKELES